MRNAQAALITAAPVAVTAGTRRDTRTVRVARLSLGWGYWDGATSARGVSKWGEQEASSVMDARKAIPGEGLLALGTSAATDLPV